MQSILSIDYGSKNVGLALKTKDSSVIFPYGVLGNNKNIFFAIKKIIEEGDIDLIVIGMPFSYDKKENQKTKQVHKFAQTLQKIISQPIKFVDERFTTAQAKKTNEKYSASLDEQAACLILDSYLQQK
jgi:putative Holliday junction resolvase